MRNVLVTLRTKNHIALPPVCSLGYKICETMLGKFAFSFFRTAYGKFSAFLSFGQISYGIVHAPNDRAARQLCTKEFTCSGKDL